MTIHNFRTLQEKYFPNCIISIPLSFFRGKKIAIDMGMLMHTMFCMASYRIIDSTNVPYEEVDKTKIYRFALNNILLKLKTFLQYGITPVCCFDSKPHFLKTETARLRKEAERKRKEDKTVGIDINTVKLMLQQMDPLLGDPTLIDTYRKLLKQTLHLDHEFVAQLETILDNLSIPKIHAKDIGLMSNDAEAIGAMLCMTGNDICVATYTEDADCSVFGCPLTILEIEEMNVMIDGKKTFTHVAKVRDLTRILTELKFSYTSFVDLCILNGTDFNLNINGCGAVNSYKLIQQYGNLDNIAKVKDISILNHIEVRKMFMCTIVKAPILKLDFDINKCKLNAKNILTTYSLEKLTNYFENL